ncbi:MAG TPA: hypothetical protein DCE03_02640, partial [Synergistaceae bacterium]|nr:hypothetical protein [Synergistaceae bacterium]
MEKRGGAFGPPLFLQKGGRVSPTRTSSNPFPPASGLLPPETEISAGHPPVPGASRGGARFFRRGIVLSASSG